MIALNAQYSAKVEYNNLLNRYDKLLIKTAQVKSDLTYKAAELEVKIKELANAGQEIISYQNELDGLRSQIKKMVDYGKAMTKEIKKAARRAWFNGIWQGVILGVAIIVSILLL